MRKLFNKAAEFLRHAEHGLVFSGAGISVESGIPPFRGDGGFWSKYDPRYLELDYFLQFPEKSWEILKEIFYEYFADARPNPAHTSLAQLEKAGIIKAVITQNIDNLHQLAGSKSVYEFHGNTGEMVCVRCGKIYSSADISLQKLPPVCSSCTGILKPNIIFFGELIPTDVSVAAFAAAEKCDVMLLVGTTGEIMPAAMLPYTAKRHNDAIIIEINPHESDYTGELTDIFLQGRAGEILPELTQMVLTGNIN